MSSQLGLRVAPLVLLLHACLPIPVQGDSIVATPLGYHQRLIAQDGYPGLAQTTDPAFYLNNGWQSDNTVAGTMRTGNWWYWNDMYLHPVADWSRDEVTGHDARDERHPPGTRPGELPVAAGWSTVEYGHYTALTSRFKPGLGMDPSATYVDRLVGGVEVEFAPFDTSLGKLNFVKVSFSASVKTLLGMSLLDDSFLSNAEGNAKGATTFQVFLPIAGGAWADLDQPLATAIAQTDTGWKTSWTGFLGTIAESEWGAGAPSVFDAIVVIIEGPPEQTDWSSQYEVRKDQQIACTLTLTADDYATRLSSDGNLSLFMHKIDEHRFKFEGNDTFDSSTYLSTTRFTGAVTYNFTPVPEPSSLVLLCSALICGGFLAARRSARRGTRV